MRYVSPPQLVVAESWAYYLDGYIPCPRLSLKMTGDVTEAMLTREECERLIQGVDYYLRRTSRDLVTIHRCVAGARVLRDEVRFLAAVTRDLCHPLAGDDARGVRELAALVEDVRGTFATTRAFWPDASTARSRPVRRAGCAR